MATVVEAMRMGMALEELMAEEAKLLSEARRMIEHNKTSNVPKGFEFKDFVTVEALRRKIKEVARQIRQTSRE